MSFRGSEATEKSAVILFPDFSPPKPDQAIAFLSVLKAPQGGARNDMVCMEKTIPKNY
jgi:hypothetical protein